MSASQAAPAEAAPALRDPRIANAVTHAGYPKSKQARDSADLGFEAWQEAFAGRVEDVAAGRLYVVKLAEADGELRLGLVASEGKVFQSKDETGEEVPCIKSLWFKRCSDSNHNWGVNPEFETYTDGKGERVCDGLPTESFLVEVDDADLTESSVGQKWSKPKFKQTLMKKLRWIATEYHKDLQAAAPRAAAASKRAKPAPKRRKKAP